MSGDPTITLTLDWDRIIAQREHSSKPGAWVEIANSTVKVQTRATLLGHCSSYSFEADIPVGVDVAAGALARVEIRIIDLPNSLASYGRILGHYESDQRHDAHAPVRLTAWSSMHAGIQGALPAAVSVQRKEN
jgi:hypothetical protein